MTDQPEKMNNKLDPPPDAKEIPEVDLERAVSELEHTQFDKIFTDLVKQRPKSVPPTSKINEPPDQTAQPDSEAHSLKSDLENRTALMLKSLVRQRSLDAEESVTNYAVNIVIVLILTSLIVLLIHIKQWYGDSRKQRAQEGNVQRILVEEPVKSLPPQLDKF